MRIGVDIDGVVLDFHEAVRDRYFAWFGSYVPEFEEWDDILAFTHFDNYADLWAWCDRANVWHDLPWVPGAPGAIDALLDDGHSVVFVTSRSGPAAAAARIWHSTTPWWKATQLVTDLGDAKHTVPCSIYIDDSPAVIEALEEAGKDVIRFVRPWNSHMKTQLAADSWRTVLDMIIDG